MKIEANKILKVNSCTSQEISTTPGKGENTMSQSSLLSTCLGQESTKEKLIDTFMEDSLHQVT